MLSGELVIGADNSWSETRTYRLTTTGASQTASFVYTGSWTYMRDQASMLFNLPALQTQFTGTRRRGQRHAQPERREHGRLLALAG